MSEPYHTYVSSSSWRCHGWCLGAIPPFLLYSCVHHSLYTQKQERRRTYFWAHFSFYYCRCMEVVLPLLYRVTLSVWCICKVMLWFNAGEVLSSKLIYGCFNLLSCICMLDMRRDPTSISNNVNGRNNNNNSNNNNSSNNNNNYLGLARTRVINRNTLTLRILLITIITTTEIVAP